MNLQLSSTKRWNRCDVCGKFIPYNDFHNGNAVTYMQTPDSELTTETYVTLCKEHK